MSGVTRSWRIPTEARPAGHESAGSCRVACEAHQVFPFVKIVRGGQRGDRETGGFSGCARLLENASGSPFHARKRGRGEPSRAAAHKVIAAIVGRTEHHLGGIQCLGGVQDARRRQVRTVAAQHDRFLRAPGESAFDGRDQPRPQIALRLTSSFDARGKGHRWRRFAEQDASLGWQRQASDQVGRIAIMAWCSSAACWAVSRPISRVFTRPATGVRANTIRCSAFTLPA